MIADRRNEALRAVFDALRAGDTESAKQLALAAFKIGCEHPVLLNLRALDHEEHGRFDEALSDLRRAHILAPNDFSILNACGLCLARMQQFEEALACYDQAIALRPDFGPAWFNSGWALEQLGERPKAAGAYLRAAELNPNNAQAWANLAWLDAWRGDAAAAREHAERALALQPDHSSAILALSRVELADPAAAEQRLKALLATPALPLYERGIALNQLGDALDALDRPSDAFATYAESNAAFRSNAKGRFEAFGQTTVLDTLGWLVPWAQQFNPAEWPADPHAGGLGGEKGHVFLIGFPRSGTTLMESALAQHPDIASLEERNTLQDAVRDFMVDARSLSDFAAMRGDELLEYRLKYWSVVKSYGGAPEGKIFIDKNPFVTLSLPLVQKLFPNAKIIFAVRDPRDVVLSCFRRMFSLNPSTYELLDLRRAAAFYNRTMQFWRILSDKLPLDQHRLVYERLVSDFQIEATAAIGFIGADWRPEMANFAERGRRGEVTSASAQQIARGLFTDGSGQWRRFRRELEPVLPVLKPWVDYFGYPPDDPS